MHPSCRQRKFRAGCVVNFARMLGSGPRMADPFQDSAEAPAAPSQAGMQQPGPPQTQQQLNPFWPDMPVPAMPDMQLDLKPEEMGLQHPTDQNPYAMLQVSALHLHAPPLSRATP